MKPEDLVKHWDAPDNSKLTPWQLSIRLPMNVSVRIAALCEMYPRKTRTEIIGDLLSTALDQLYAGLSDTPYKGEISRAEEADVPEEAIAEMVLGDKGRFLGLVRKFEKEHEQKIVEFEQDKSRESVGTSEPATRAPRGGGASTRIHKAERPAAAPRGDQRSRKRGAGGGRRSGRD